MHSTLDTALLEARGLKPYVFKHVGTSWLDEYLGVGYSVPRGGWTNCLKMFGKVGVYHKYTPIKDQQGGLAVAGYGSYAVSRTCSTPLCSILAMEDKVVDSWSTLAVACFQLPEKTKLLGVALTVSLAFAAVSVPALSERFRVRVSPSLPRLLPSTSLTTHSPTAVVNRTDGSGRQTLPSVASGTTTNA